VLSVAAVRPTLVVSLHHTTQPTVRLSMSVGHAADVLSQARDTRFLRACALGDTRVVVRLLRAGADPNATCGAHRETVLILVCRLQRTDLVQIMLEHGADPNLTNRNGVTALMFLAGEAHVDIVRLLLEHGAHVDQREPYVRSTALSYALENADLPGGLEVVQLLCSYGASREDVSTDDNGNVESASAVLAEYAEFDMAATAEWLELTCAWTTPLHHIEFLTLARARELLQRGASIHERAAAGQPSPLDLAKDLVPTGAFCPGLPAALLLRHWQACLLAFAMGTHYRLGLGSHVRLLSGNHDLLELVVAFASTL